MVGTYCRSTTITGILCGAEVKQLEPALLERLAANGLTVEQADNAAQQVVKAVLRSLPEMQALVKEMGASNRDGCVNICRFFNVPYA